MSVDAKKIEELQGNIRIESPMLTDYEQMRVKFMFEPKARFELLYRGTKDGFTEQAFGDKCDNQGDTLIIVKATTGQIFGGYTNIPWASPG